jgi:protein SCO1/2
MSPPRASVLRFPSKPVAATARDGVASARPGDAAAPSAVARAPALFQHRAAGTAEAGRRPTGRRLPLALAAAVRMLAAALLVALAGVPARAGLTAAELAGVAVTPPTGARLDLSLRGPKRPVVLIFADFTCGELCDAILAQTAGALAETGLSPARDYALAVVGIDPRDSLAQGRAFARAQVPPALLAQLTLLRPDAARLRRMTAALGYGFAYDAGNDRFAHPAVRFVLAADGRLSRVLPAFEAGPDELKAAILAAGRGAAIPFVRRLALYCYGYDPVTGRFSGLIERLTLLLAALTAIGLFSGIALALRRERRQRQGQPPGPAPREVDR